MAIIYRGIIGGNYIYWTENDPIPGGVSDIAAVNTPVLTASHVDRSVYAPDGISGSLQTLTGSQPYIVGGPNITVVTNSLGQVEITGSASGAGGIKYALSSTDNIVVQDRYQYLVQGYITIDPSGSLTSDPGGQIVILP